MLQQNYITSAVVIRDRTVYKNGSRLFADNEADTGSFLISAYHHFQLAYPKFYKMDRLSKLGLLAAELLLKDGAARTEFQPGDAGVVITNASASLDTDIKYFETVSNIASPALFVYTLPNIMIGEICIRNNFKGENAFFVFNQFNATFIAQYVSNLLDSGNLEVCICGWVELLAESQHAVLYLVEKLPAGEDVLLFTIDNINKFYEIENG